LDYGIARVARCGSGGTNECMGPHLSLRSRAGLHQGVSKAESGSDLGFAHFPEEPRAGVGPPAFRRWFGNPESLSGLINGKADEIPQFNELGLLGLGEGEFLQRVVDGEHLVIIGVRGQFQIVDVLPDLSAAVADRMTAAGPIDQNASHGLGGGGEKMRAVLPLGLIVTTEPQPRFVDERSGLKGLTGSFMEHFCCGEFAQVIIDQGHELIGRQDIALRDTIQNDSDLVHGRANSTSAREIEARIADGKL